MNPAYRWLTFGILISSLCSPLAQAGGESSGGGADDYHIVPAFFKSSEQGSLVRACYQVAPNFGIDPLIVADMIRSSFKQWGDYLEQKRLSLVPGHTLIVTELDLSATCKGDENLTFYIGVENDLVRQYRGQFSKPFGFAQLVTEADYTNGYQAKGFVWIAPPNSIPATPDPNAAISAPQMVPVWSSSTQDALAGLLLHEIGHVFGNGHVDGTVMTEKIGQYLENDTTPGKTSRNVALYSTIDSQIELVPCMECHMGYAAAETFDPIQVPGQGSASDWIWTFRTLTGKEPVPPMAIRYERLGSPQGSGRLTLIDSTGDYVFAVNVESMIGQRTDSTPLFAGQGGITFYSFGASYFSQIKTLGGTEIPVAVNYNMDGKMAEILPLGTDFYPRPIFVSAD